MFTIAPKGRGWSVTISDLASIEPEYHFNESELKREARDRMWRALRKRVAHGPAVRL